MGPSLGDLFNKSDHVNEDFIHKLSRSFLPCFWTSLDHFTSIVRMRIDERKAILTHDIKFMKYKLVMGWWTFHQPYPRFRMRWFKSCIVSNSSRYQKYFLYFFLCKKPTHQVVTEDFSWVGTVLDSCMLEQNI